MTLRNRFVVRVLLTIISALFVFSASGFPQEGRHSGRGTLMIESRVYYGYIYPHHTQLEYFNAQFPAFEICLARQTSGIYEWQRSYGLPIVGLSFFYSGLGYNPSLRQVYSLMP